MEKDAASRTCLGRHLLYRLEVLEMLGRLLHNKNILTCVKRNSMVLLQQFLQTLALSSLQQNKNIGCISPPLFTDQLVKLRLAEL